MRVLISAYAAEPGKGSEPEVGLRTILAAATQHHVTVITRANNVDHLVSAIEQAGVGERVDVHGIDLSPAALRAKRMGQAGLHWYYGRWQQRAASLAFELDRANPFDLVHHATFAAYWTEAGVADLDRPFVWGPVGGGVGLPKALWRVLGLKGAATEFVRATVVRSAGLRTTRSLGRRAEVILVQNRDTASRLGGAGERAMILPNATSISVDVPPPSAPRSSDVIFAGRLLPWKGAALALDSIRRVSHPTARLHIFGEGPEEPRIRRLIERWDLRNRAVLRGRTTREALLGEIRHAGVLLHTALREEAGLVPAEALALGTPLVALLHGGPGELTRRYPHSPALLVPPDSPSATASKMAAAIDAFLTHPKVPIPFAPHDSTPTFAEALLDAYDQAVSLRRKG